MEPRIFCAIKSIINNWILCQFSVGNGLIYSSEILIYDPASTQIQVTNFGIAHLPGRQSDVHTAGAQAAPGIILIEAIVKWCLRQERRIAISLCRSRPIWIDSPSVSN